MVWEKEKSNGGDTYIAFIIFIYNNGEKNNILLCVQFGWVKRSHNQCVLFIKNFCCY